MRKPILFLISFLLATAAFHPECKAQTAFSKSSIYAQTGPMPSISYDRIWYQKDGLKISTGIGLSYIYVELFDRHLIAAPIELNAYYGKTHHAELSLGYLPLMRYTKDYTGNDWISDVNHFNYFKLGYRFHKAAGGSLLFRLNWNPILAYENIFDEPYYFLAPPVEDAAEFQFIPLHFSAAIGFSLKGK